MSRIAIPASIESAPDIQANFKAIERRFGKVPNFYRIMALNSQARKDISECSTLRKGEAFSSDAQPYCASNNRDSQLRILPVHAHTTASSAAAPIGYRGKAATEDLDEVRAAGYGDDEILEIVLHVALNIGLIILTTPLTPTSTPDRQSRPVTPKSYLGHRKRLENGRAFVGLFTSSEHDLMSASHARRQCPYFRCCRSDR